MASGAGAETLTPTRISSSLNNSAADVTVTYTDTDTADADIIYAPVEPGSADAMTLNVNSLTIDNETTAGTVQIQTGTKEVTGSDGTVTEEPVYTTYDKNGGGIATNPAYSGTNITLTTASDLAVTARTTALLATGGSSITGTIGGNLTVNSQDVGISAAETTAGDGTTQAVKLTISGDTADIQAVQDALTVSGSNSSMTIQGAQSTIIHSDSGHAVTNLGHELHIVGDVTDQLSGTILIENGSSTEAAYYQNSSSTDRSSIYAGSVTVKNTAGASAILIVEGETTIDGAAGTGVQIINNSAENATIVAGPDTDSGDEDVTGSIYINTSNSPLVIKNENKDGYVIVARNHGSVAMDYFHNSYNTEIVGKVLIDQQSGAIISSEGGIIQSDSMTVTDSSSLHLYVNGDTVFSSSSGGKSQITGDNLSDLSLQSIDTAVANADVTLTNQSIGSFYLQGSGVWNGDVSIDKGLTRYSSIYMTENSRFNGDVALKNGTMAIAYLLQNAVFTGDLTATGSAQGEDSTTNSYFLLQLGGNGTINGNLIASDQGTISAAFTESGTQLNGNLSSESGGTITMQSAGTWTGSSSVSGGTADVTFTGSSAVWNVTGNSELTNFTQASGTVNFPAASASGFTGTTVTVDGNYSSDGGSITMSTVLQGDTSPHDELDIKGDATSTATITFTKVSGYGSQTIEGIKVVEVDGNSDAVFTKPDSNRLTAGAYIYDLKKVGKDWYLTSQRDPDAPVPVVPRTNDDDPAEEPEQPDILPPTDPTDPTAHIVKPELGSYAANLLASNTLFNMSLSDRLGETRYSDALKAQKHSGNIWIRTAGGKSHTRMLDDQLTNRGTWGLVQVGGDVVSWAGSGDHRFHAGLMMGYAHQSEKTRSSEVGVTSKGKVSGYSAGLYATYMNAAPAGTGPYVDTWVMWQKFKNKVDPSNSVEESYDSKGFTASLEAGYTFGLKDWVSPDGMNNAARFRLEAQVIRMGVRADQHVDAENFTVAGTGAGNVRTRIGATLYNLVSNEKTGRAIKPFLGLNWYHDTKSFGVTYDGVHDRILGNRNFGEVKLGLEGKLSKHVNLWGAAAYQQGSHGFRNFGAFIGAKALF